MTTRLNPITTPRFEARAEKARRNKEPMFGGAIKAFQHMENHPDIYYMVRPGTDLNLPERAQAEVETKIRVQQALILLSKSNFFNGFSMTPEIRELLNKQYPEGVSRDSLEEVRDFIIRANEEETPITLAKQEVF